MYLTRWPVSLFPIGLTCDKEMRVISTRTSYSSSPEEGAVDKPSKKFDYAWWGGSGKRRGHLHKWKTAIFPTRDRGRMGATQQKYKHKFCRTSLWQHWKKWSVATLKHHKMSWFWKAAGENTHLINSYVCISVRETSFVCTADDKWPQPLVFKWSHVFKYMWVRQKDTRTHGLWFTSWCLLLCFTTLSNRGTKANVA